MDEFIISFLNTVWLVLLALAGKLIEIATAHTLVLEYNIAGAKELSNNLGKCNSVVSETQNSSTEINI